MVAAPLTTVEGRALCLSQSTCTLSVSSPSFLRRLSTSPPSSSSTPPNSSFSLALTTATPSPAEASYSSSIDVGVSKILRISKIWIMSIEQNSRRMDFLSIPSYVLYLVVHMLMGITPQEMLKI
ncbi:uncharacterized protein LOC120295776 [Eucalyptus grandis]|uniref:uncharacterized protein LOC120295776 n=1 Tax=Eucalyptus grandis TaxID=71139 RepID=UPI00192F0272|nr:uncharacterized protein LOC120295776 [Eucalyptus grandis]